MSMGRYSALFMVALVMQPGMAAACKLENATFRPKYSAEHFEIRSSRDGRGYVFDLMVWKTNEQFRFRVDVDASTGAGTIRSAPDSAGQNPGIRTSFRLLDGKSLETTLDGEIGRVSFLDMGRAFVDFRMRSSRSVEPYTSPPSGLWNVTNCRSS
ncbi:hypothetical protein [Microvirga makkahensis]|uniref:Uncharacterized protein n=1 Tax=Microvirga makkahensis TaxID=1128670 RepID=A0A7X3SRF8_9HYPH|nr:hypothetical protein [Microvirga makkahensis]MXQ14089.1 hypothetical protein [Microvirga makkahensis]